MSAIQDIELKTIAGDDSTLADYRGKVLLIVNVASKCGLTKQYEALETTYERYRDQGLVVLGFPANDFKGQEPGTDAEIQQFCTLTYDVQFPMFSKITVTGADKHPLYASLTSALPETQGKEGADFRASLKGYGIEPNPAPEVLWNFEKFLLGRTGEVVARFAPNVAPDDEIVVQAIERELSK